MNMKIQDHRVKIVSFDNALGGLDIAVERNILWPCYVFTISIPEKKKKGLNIFEETILKLTDIELGDAEQLAETTCLDIEIVMFIQSRLSQLGLISKHFELTQHGKEILCEWEKKSSKDREYISAKIFFDVLSGNVLPYIHVGNLRYERIEKIKGKSHIYFSLGTRGKEKKISARKVPFEEKYPLKTNIDASDVIKAIKECRRIHKRYAILNPKIDRDLPPIPRAEAVSIQDNPELTYVNCKIIIQKGNPEIIVTDGFGYGTSQNFSNYLKKQNWSWLVDLKSKGIINEVGEKQQSQDNVKSHKSYKYPEVSRRLKNAENDINEIKNLQGTSSKEEKRKEKIERVITNLYASLEWTLRQVVYDNQVDEWEKIYENQSYKDNEKLLYGFAEKAGLSVTEKNKSILQIKPGAIGQIYNGVVELQPLLALAITGINDNNSHPMYALSKFKPNFLSFVKKLKILRDPSEHGNSKDLKVTFEELQIIFNKLSEIIFTLLPGVSNDLEENSNDYARVESDIDQERLKASVELEKFFGFSVINEMNSNLKMQLMRSEIISNELSDDNHLELIKCLASAMQLIFYEIIKDRRQSGDLGANAKGEATKRAIKSGFIDNIASIPDSISTVSDKRINLTIQGKSTTLGAHFIVFFVLSSNDELAHFYREIPKLVELVDKLLVLRGHGNNQFKVVENDSLLLLKNMVYKAIKILTEV